jgi:tetratricopeptide (TPR) repeat protein
MDTRAQITSAVTAAVIAALAAISVAIINQRATSTSKPNSSAPPHIIQTTHGPGSHTVGYMQGDFYANYGISEEKYDRLRAEFGVTDSALQSFFKILEQQRVPREDLDSTLRDIAKRYKDLQEQLRVFTSDDPAVLSLKQAASQAFEAGDFAQVEKLLNDASLKDLERAQRLQGTIQQLQAETTKVLLSAAASQAELGALKNTQLQYAEAARYYRQAAELVESIRPGSEALLATYLTQWGFASNHAGDYRSAEPPLQRALALREQVLGPAHVDVAETVNALAELYYLQGRYTEAEPLYHRALAIREKALGHEHPRVAESLTNLGTLYLTQWRHSKAEPLYQRALAIREKVLGPEHPDTAMSLSNLASFYKALGQYAQAAPLFERALALREKALGPEHLHIAINLNNLVMLYQAQGRYAEAEPRSQRALAIWEKVLGPDHPQVATGLGHYAALLRATNRTPEADKLESRAKAIRATYAHENSPQ